MTNSLNSMIPAAAALMVLGTMAAASLAPLGPTKRGLWRVPAALSVLFFAASLLPIASGGVLGFWTEHVRNDWGNQIFVDLLFCAGSAFFLILPRARAVGMNPLLWLLGIGATGSIGLLATLARLLYLEEKA